MGLCKCRNITDLYCFVHKKPVCQACICPEHQVCVIGTYVEWLQDPDYDPPICSICKDPVHDDNVLRLMCLHLFHPECIDVHAASFPPNTAQAGFTCPNCPRPIIPPATATSPLARLLQEHLKNATWLQQVEKVTVSPNDTAKGGLRKYHTVGDGGSPGSQDIAIDISMGSEGIASRKSIKAVSAKNLDLESSAQRNSFVDDDDDKYHKPHLSHMLQDLLKKEDSPPGKKRAPFRVTPRNLLIVFGLLSILCTILFLHRSLSAMP